MRPKLESGYEGVIFRILPFLVVVKEEQQAERHRDWPYRIENDACPVAAALAAQPMLLFVFLVMLFFVELGCLYSQLVVVVSQQPVSFAVHQGCDSLTNTLDDVQYLFQ